MPAVYAITPLVFCCIERLYAACRYGTRSDSDGNNFGLRNRPAVHGSSALESRYLILGALAIAWQVFASHPQPLVYASLVAIAYALCRAVDIPGISSTKSHEEDTKETSMPGSPFVFLRVTSWMNPTLPRGRFLAMVALMYLLGAMLAAIQLVPAWELVRQSMRARLPYETFGQNALHPWSFLVALFPFLHGGGQGIYQLPFQGPYWHHNEAQIYLGALALSLAITGAAWSWRRRDRPCMFWAASALVAMALSLGHYAGPLGRLLYRMPVLGDFRSANRWWMIVVMATATLAGYTTHCLIESDAAAWDRLTRTARRVGLAIALFCTVTGLLLLWRPDNAEGLIRAWTGWPGSAGFLRAAGAELFIPIALSLAAWILIKNWSAAKPRWWYAAMLAFLIFDFGLYATFAPIRMGAGFEWMMGGLAPQSLRDSRDAPAPARAHWMLAPGALAFEPFWFYGHEMATGRDPLINARYKQFTGLDEGGFSQRLSIVETPDRTLDLLNVRHLIALPDLAATLHKAGNANAALVNYDTYAFLADQALHLDLPPGQATGYAVTGAGDTLAVVSALANSGGAAHGQEVASIKVSCGGVRSISLALQAGRDTAEWSWDRPDLRGVIPHARPRPAASWTASHNGKTFAGHTWLALYSLPDDFRACGAPIQVTVTNTATDATVVGMRQVTLYDTATQRSYPMGRGDGLGDPLRWREMRAEQPMPGGPRLQTYENLRAMPRAWLVTHTQAASDEEQLRFIRGETKGAAGNSFDPRAVALISPETAAQLPAALREAGQPAAAGEGKVNIISRDAANMSLDIETDRPALLVLSEPWYPGWQALVDAAPRPIHRVDYLLRGI
ncbi:MAG: hypothetical protein ACKV2V_07280, partial [Blastocatellia bacterium]